ncbi:hypothetical protein [Bacillus sp. AK031]
MVYLAFTDKIAYALGAVFIYLTTIGLASYLHFKLTEKRYGSLEDFDLQIRKEFIENVCIRTSVDLNQEKENKLVESSLQRRLQKSQSGNQFKKTIYLGIATSIFPLLITLFLQNIGDVIFLTIGITIFGFILLIFSTRFILNEYSSITKTEKIMEITEEIRLLNQVSQRLEAAT